VERAPLVGRAWALERLTAALAAAGSQHGSTVLVGGEAGIGKSRIAAKLAATAREQGWLVLVGRCFDLIGAGVPYLPVAEAIRSVRGPSAPGNPFDTAGLRRYTMMPRRGCSPRYGRCWTRSAPSSLCS